MIACVAIANRLPLYTCNPKDFKGLDHLLMVVPVSRPQWGHEGHDDSLKRLS